MRVDPFDIDWIESDPNGRDVLMLKSIAAAREFVGKHQDGEYLSTMEARCVIRDPDFIEKSVSRPDRHNYYLVDESRTNPYARVTVACYDDENSGIAISWSRYKKPVSAAGRIYPKGEDSGDVFDRRG